MPHFYFHLHNDLEALDPEGRDLPDLAAARDAATRAVRELAAETVAEGRLNLGHFVEVADGAGEPLFRVAFGDVITITE